ncbi:MAG: oxalate/formate MFS antiporter [Burkholderiaceae bacterium]
MDTIRTVSTTRDSRTRWWQLAYGLIAMMAISSPQYVWALFTKDLSRLLNASLAEVQVTFAILIVAQTFLSPFQGYLIDKFGPRLLLSAGAILTALSWILASQVTGIWGLYLTYGLLGGIGTGIIYVGVIGLMVQWFPDKRGFAVGMVAAGYGFGAILTTFAISGHVKTAGISSTLWIFGLGIGVIGFLAAQGMRPPKASEVAAFVAKTNASDRESPNSYRSIDMLRKPVFWLLFFMMTMMSTAGLMVISQIGAIANDLKVADTMILGMAALPLALAIDRIANGLTRPFFGWVSDHIGRENTMFLAFGLEGVAMSAWLLTMHHPVLFVLLSGLVFFGWGEIFSLFPAALTDIFGTKHATTNYGFLYMSQGVGSILGGPAAAWMREATGSWTPVLTVVIALNFLTAILALAALKPMRRSFVERAKSDPQAIHDPIEAVAR